MLAITFRNWKLYQGEAARYDNSKWFRLENKLPDHALWDELSGDEFKAFLWLFCFVSRTAHKTGAIELDARTGARQAGVSIETFLSTVEKLHRLEVIESSAALPMHGALTVQSPCENGEITAPTCTGTGTKEFLLRSNSLPPPPEEISDSSLTNPADTAALDPDPPAPLFPKGEVAELAAQTAPQLDGDLRRLPFGDPDVLEFLETHNVSAKIAHGWVRAFGDDQPACESALRGVILKLLSNPNKLVELEVRKRPIAAYLTGAMTDMAAGRPSTVMKPLRLAPNELSPGPAPNSVREAARIAEDKRIAEEAAERIREEEERSRKALEAVPPEERRRQVAALVASITGGKKRGAP